MSDAAVRLASAMYDAVAACSPTGANGAAVVEGEELLQAAALLAGRTIGEAPDAQTREAMLDELIDLVERVVAEFVRQGRSANVIDFAAANVNRPT